MTVSTTKETQMEILIDGAPITIDASGIDSFQELLKHIENTVIDKSRVITQIILNEENLDESQEIGLGAFPVAEIATLSIETSNTTHLAYEALEDALEYLPTLSAVLEVASGKIREGFIREGLQKISEALEVVGAFGEVLDGIRGAFRIDYSKVRIDEFSLLDKLNELGKLAQEILKAAKDENWTLIADLTEYELSPLLYEWIAILPELIAMLPCDHEETVEGQDE
jgi:hypothetical protein